MSELVHKELSYKIIGILFSVYRELGGGHQERIYYRAIKELFGKEKISYQEQCPVDIQFNGNKIGKYFLDYSIDNKIILEIKVGQRFKSQDIRQVYSYLKALNLQLGILANFTRDGVQYRRILNLY